MMDNKITKIGHTSQNTDAIVLLLCGILVFSPLSSFVTMGILHFPLALPELLFIPFFFYLRKIFDFSIDFRKLVLFLMIIFTLIAISLIVGKFRISSVLSTSRGYIYMAVVFSGFHNKKISDIHPILMIAFGSMIGWLIMSLLSFRTLVSSLVNEESRVAYGNMIALCIAVSIAIIYSKKKFLPYILLVGLAISLTSGLRRQIAIFLLSFFLSKFISMKLSLMKTIRSLCIIAFLIAILSPFYEDIKSSINDISPFLYYRIFEKSERLVSGELTEGDVERMDNFNYFIDNLGTYIIPQGFVSKRTLADEGTGIYMDSPYIELFYTFSIPGCLIFILIFIKSLHFHLKNYYLNNIRESGICIVSGIIIVILLLIEGSFLNFVFVAPFTGYILSRIFSRVNLIAG